MTSISQLVEKQRAFFATGKTKPYAFRKAQLIALRNGIRKYEREIMEALYKDLRKSEFEAYATEIGFVLAEITHNLKHLRSWMRRERVRAPLSHFGTKNYIIREPYGVILNIVPWNYPINLALTILVNAIAAGNTMVIKPSELSPNSSAVIAKLIADTFPEEYVAVVEGGVEESTELLQQTFDYIIYTGNGTVGKIVMEAAAKHLTPVTLELGGKSPCVVHEDADLELAAKRIAWGKWINAGQTCIAPDYLFVHKRVKPQLIEAIIRYVERFYGTDIKKMDGMTTIINERHFDRIEKLMQGAKIIYGGYTDRSSKYISPTIVEGVDWNHPVMQEEIFGPVLPVLEYEQIEDAFAQIIAQPKPLAFYIFTNNKSIENAALERVSFGGGCVNDILYHMANPNLPFGGVGASGMGAYHGKAGFDLFSHKKSVLKQQTLFDIPVRYPSTKNGLNLIRKILK